MTEPRLILIGVLLLAAAAALFVLLFSRKSERKADAGPPAGAGAHPIPPESEAPLPSGTGEAAAAVPGPAFAGGLLRGALLFLAAVVAAGFVIVVLPQGAIDWMAGLLRPGSSEAPEPEKIAFLYLGDDLKDKEFHIRGVVRNITTVPIEKLDVTIRFYVPGGQLVETRSVRMDSELIAPDQTAQFHLVYPDYGGQFASYSVEFVLRQGEVLRYKDMRATRGRG